MTNKKIALIKLKKEPRKPVQLKYVKRILIEDIDCMTFDSLLKVINNCKYPLKLCSVNIESYSDQYDSETTAEVYYSGPETPADYKVRLKHYNEEHKEYLKWYGENKDLIEKELTRRKTIADAKEEKAKRKTLIALSKKIIKDKKELAKLKKEIE